MNNNKFKWQRSFHDHIIRNDRSLNNIREYIINTPGTWEKDENNIKNNELTGQAGLTKNKKAKRNNHRGHREKNKKRQKLTTKGTKKKI
ncbi:MAG: hypothetical protein U9Q24_01140 [Candidatus Ratteibacteria bacterium]|nr:hypothetical protein [Candidatus Ratteibacteria bacterium]